MGGAQGCSGDGDGSNGAEPPPTATLDGGVVDGAESTPPDSPSSPVDARLDSTSLADTSRADAPADAPGAAQDAPSTTASCTASPHAVCVDFEDGTMGGWSVNGTGGRVETGNAAHGAHALHITQLTSSTMISPPSLGTITSTMWGRFYLYMTPGAPMGHGAIVNAYDQSHNFFEEGWSNNSFFGNWHVPAGVPERYEVSTTGQYKVPNGQWACVEVLFDGATPKNTQVWHDGKPVVFDVVASSPAIVPVNHFTKIEVGYRNYHGLSLTAYDGMTPPILADMWLDDIAFDKNRIGCLP
jgi:hypothetical protein